MSEPVSAVIVNFNSGPYLATCLASLSDNLDARPWDVVVVDNASTDSSERCAETSTPPVGLIRNTTNIGFAKAVNQGIAATKGDLIVILNPDCRLLPGTFSVLASELGRHSDCAIAGPRVLDEDGTVQGSARGDPTMSTGLFGRSTRLSKLFPHTRLARKNVQTHAAIASGLSSVEVDWVAGACMLARREALQAVGGFDERYFMYWEDADLCRRLRADGCRVRYVPGAHVVHAVGRSSRADQRSAVQAFHRSAYTYYTTHVAQHRANPARWLAWVLLTLRCWWKLRGATHNRSG